MAPLSLDDVTWAGKPHPEIRRIAAADGSILIVPVGSLEQHGYHLPTATDSVLADATARLGAERVADRVPVLVTPVLWSGHSPMHLDSFGATLSVTLEHLLGTLEDVGETGLDNGFDGLVILNGHGGNGPAIDGAVSNLGARHPSVEVVGLTYYHLVAEFADDVRESGSGGMSHGGELETSLMMYLYPDHVHAGRIEGWERRDMAYRHAAPDMTESGPINVYRSSDRYSESGVEGDPTVASPETGELLFERIGDELEGLLDDLHAVVTGAADA
jgi:creatinine amidohydrolase